MRNIYNFIYLLISKLYLFFCGFRNIDVTACAIHTNSGICIWLIGIMLIDSGIHFYAHFPISVLTSLHWEISEVS